MKSIYTTILLLFICYNFNACAQNKTMATSDNQLPYYQIPDYPESYTAEHVAARMVDGLGYRYFWATQELRPEDLAYKPSEDSRTIDETLDHLLGLTDLVKNTCAKQPNIRGGDQKKEVLTFEEKRKRTLENIKAASDLLKAEGASLEEMSIIFQRGERKSEFPFWNNVNGPIADALWHAGQIVVLRRANGNPIPPGVNVFMGKTRER